MANSQTLAVPDPEIPTSELLGKALGPSNHHVGAVVAAGNLGRGPNLGGDDDRETQQDDAERPRDEGSPEAYEATHVHSVYDRIAPHFSATRHKPWPLVTSFLASQRPGSLGLDVGCGNGKYLSARDAERDVFLVGCDRSAALVQLARRHRGPDLAEGGMAVRGARQEEREVLVADSLSLPFRTGCADFAICIAVVHHLSTRDRRRGAVAELLRCVRGDEATVLVYVWALEQASSRRGWDEGGEQDQLVPWVVKGDQGKKGKKKKKKKKDMHGPEEQMARGKGRNRNGGDDEGPENGGQEEQDKDRAKNNGTGGGDGNELAKEEEEEEDGDDQKATTDQTFQRYYHLYRKGELEEDILAVGGRVLNSGYERDNWWAIAAAVPAEKD